MKIGIVALNYVPGTIGGAESYYVDLIKYLQEIDHKNQYVIFMRDAYSDLVPVSNNFTIKLVTHSKLSLMVAKILKKFLKYDMQQALINNQHCDVLHFPFQVVDFFGLRARVISTAIDIQEEFYPENFTPEDLVNRKRLHALSVERSDYLIAISDFTRDTYLEKYKIKKSKISTVHLSYNEALYNTVKHNNTLDLPKKYFYYPAATWPHKNHEALLRAFAVFVRSNPGYSLVLSGIKKQKANDIHTLAEDLHISSNVVMLGYVERERLPELHQRSVVVVFPSLFEGFGIPLLEAMACGAPVLCSKTTSLPEVGGDAAIYFDPTDPRAIADAMARIAEDKELRSTLTKKGLAQAEKFSARKTAEQTLEIYRKIGAQDA